MTLDQLLSENKYKEQFIYVRQGHVDFFNIILCGITRPNPDYSIDWNPNGVPCTIYDYIRRGRGYIETSDGVTPVSAGDLLFMARGTRLRLYADPDEPFEKIWIQTTGSLMHGLRDMYGMNGRVIVQHVDAAASFDRIQSVLSHSTPATILTDLSVCSAAVMEMTAALMKSEVFGDTDTTSVPAQIRSMLDGALYTPLSLDMIAEQLHLTPTHLIRLFRAAYNTTPKKYLSDRRIAQAKILLRDTSLPIHSIAESLCYADSRYFASAFRKETGFTPRDYRISAEHGE